jgi:hypothetical protein
MGLLDAPCLGCSGASAGSGATVNPVQVGDLILARQQTPILEQAGQLACNRLSERIENNGDLLWID